MSPLVDETSPSTGDVIVKSKIISIMAFVFVVERDHKTGKLFAGEVSTYDNGDARSYDTEAEAQKVADVLNKAEARFEGLQFGLPSECTAYAEYCGETGHAVINTEVGLNSIHKDYFSRYDNEELDEVLEEADLFTEWYNSAVVGVYPE